MQLTIIPYDKHSYERRKQAKAMGVDEFELADEPDYDTRLDCADEDW